VEPFKTI